MLSELKEKFNNNYVEVIIQRKKFSGQLFIEKNKCILEVYIEEKDFEKYFRSLDKEYELLCGRLIPNDTLITFIDCWNVGGSSTVIDNRGDIYKCKGKLRFNCHSIILGTNLKSLNKSEITNTKVTYDKIDDFFSKKIVENVFLMKDIKIIPENNSYKIKSGIIEFNNYPSISEQSNCYTIKSNPIVSINYKSSTTFNKNHTNIYKYRNLLMILLKKPIIINKYTISVNSAEHLVYEFGNTNLEIDLNELNEIVSHRRIKIENINNFADVLEKFNKHYNKIYLTLEEIYNYVFYDLPWLNRFVNSINMIESLAGTYFEKQALKRTINEYYKKPNAKKCNEPKNSNFIDQTIVLIKNVNNIFNFSDSEIENIGEVIKDTRIFLFHYSEKKKKQINKKKVKEEEQIKLAYFIEDVIMLNIYLLLGLHTNNKDALSFYDFYYNKNDLT